MSCVGVITTPIREPLTAAHDNCLAFFRGIWHGGTATGTRREQQKLASSSYSYCANNRRIDVVDCSAPLCSNEERFGLKGREDHLVCLNMAPLCSGWVAGDSMLQMSLFWFIQGKHLSDFIFLLCWMFPWACMATLPIILLTFYLFIHLIVNRQGGYVLGSICLSVFFGCLSVC